MNMRHAYFIAIITVMAAASPLVWAATNQFSVSASSSVNYTINGVNDPPLTLVRGFSYVFNINAGSFHPFYIKTTPGIGSGNTYTNGVSAQGVTSGTITFDVPETAPDTLHYQCGNHGGMTGPLNIMDAPDITITDFSVNTNITLKSTGTDALNLNVLTASSLTNDSWFSVAIESNAFSAGTNTTQVALPAGNVAFYRVQQGFF